MGLIIIAPDSFKGSLSARQAACAIERGILRCDPAARTLTLPLADGGEGTLDALTAPADRFTLEVRGPYGESLRASYGFAGDSAVIEMAEAAGLCKTENRRTADASTYGVGQLMADALARGFRKILLTAGGSATTDGGCGMMAALGVRFTDADGKCFVPTGGTLCRIADFDLTGLPEAFGRTQITIAADVRNPLLGPDGTVAVYAPQKGADAADLVRLEEGMTHLAELLRRRCGTDVASVPGCGAAGGLPAFLLAFAGAQIRPGIATVLAVSGLADLVRAGDVETVITGEGKLDRQSLWGKTVSGVTGICGPAGIPVDCLVGCVGDDPAVLRSMGIRRILAVTDAAPDTGSAMKYAERWLEELAFRWRSSPDGTA